MSNTKHTPAPFRLAFRDEGGMWNAYLARHGTMKGAVLMGSIRIGVVEAVPEVRQAFMETMKLMLNAAVREVTGVDVSWPIPPQASEDGD